MQDYCKSNQPISLKLNVIIGPTNRKNWSLVVTRGPRYRFYIAFPLSSPLWNRNFRRFITISHSHWPIFTTHGEMTVIDRLMSPQHFGSNLADVTSSVRMSIFPVTMWLLFASKSPVPTNTRNVLKSVTKIVELHQFSCSVWLMLWLTNIVTFIQYLYVFIIVFNFWKVLRLYNEESLSLFLSFGVAHAPFAYQRWGLPHRLAQCVTLGKGLL